MIFIFHVVGTAMEVFKTSVGSWIYPEASLLRIGGVPLFSGFMYAAIGSYIARCWRLFDFRFSAIRRSGRWAAWRVGIYVNFFAHHYVADVRLALFAATALLFGRCWVHFKVWRAAPAHAAAAGLHPGRAVHLVCREYRHLHGGLDVPPPAARLGAGAARANSAPGSSDDHQLRPGGDAEPTAAASAGEPMRRRGALRQTGARAAPRP